jgi:hypothetical protein
MGPNKGETGPVRPSERGWDRGPSDAVDDLDFGPGEIAEPLELNTTRRKII